ncbi:methyltransferase domain-containing protein [Candidatus Gottesmanbacteria bacterium]|nr:methyltransferase domain-containing protein [Candidatus Gottesmanbacteria bacterium]
MVNPETLVEGDVLARYQDAFRRVPDGPGAVLDVGGSRNFPERDELLGADRQVTSLNLPDEPHRRVPDIYGDGTALPYKDGAFSFVSAVDVLEHVSSHLRPRFVAEMVRVTSSRAVIIAPLGGKENYSSERELLDRMEAAELDPKQSFLNHQKLGLPTLRELVTIGRSLRLPFDIFPATHRSTLFQSLRDQVTAFSVDKGEVGQAIAREIASSAQDMLMQTNVPPWEDAYRAGMVVKKHEPGNIVLDNKKLFLAENEMMAYQAAFRRAGWQSVRSEEDFRWYNKYPLRGRTINIEGPEGSGKTSLVRRLVQDLSAWGYTVSTQTDHGVRQWIRDMERKVGRAEVLGDPERAEFFFFAMWQAAVAGNAFSLLGPCHVNVSDRGLESVRMHHGLHCPTNRTIPYTMQEHPLAVAPDLTVLLWVDDAEHNYHLMQKDGDPVNKTKGPDALAFQRRFYDHLWKDGGSRFTGPIVRVVNPGTEGSFEPVVAEVKSLIEQKTGIPTT